jgi:hypothetical protein
MKNLTIEKLQMYENYKKIYTDGPKRGKQTGWGMTTDDEDKNRRLFDNTTIYAAEMYGILNEIEFGERAEGTQCQQWKHSEVQQKGG